uniref:Uncharacterized protein LOC116946209 isoform X1 n=2 Tax=Petromyzon marinus TaxID=7757 RepID=A0AAJ7X0S8_PETMA|nr:uncharacterized protein LOC116946209 isoform X1 [Petromyzon marinus]
MTDILSLPDLHLEGFLEKQREKLRFHWRRYWFVLRNSSLCYYPSRGSPMPRGRVDVHSVQSVRELNTVNREHVFQVVLSSGKVIILAAASGEQRSVWIQFLWKCMQLPGPGRSVSACAWHDIPELLEKATRLREEEEERGLERSLSERTAGGSCRSSGIESGDGGGRGSAGLVRSATVTAVTPGGARRGDARLSGTKSSSSPSGGRCRSRGSRVGVTVTQSLADVLSFIKPGYRCSGASSSSTASSDSDSQTKRDSLDSGLSDMAEQQGSEGLTLGSRGAKDAAWERPDSLLEAPGEPRRAAEEETHGQIHAAPRSGSAAPTCVETDGSSGTLCATTDAEAASGAPTSPGAGEVPDPPEGVSIDAAWGHGSEVVLGSNARESRDLEEVLYEAMK